MLQYKKTIATIMVISSSTAFAGGMGISCTAEGVTVPCENSAWGFGIQALYLQPIATADFGYSTYTGTVTSNSLTTTYNGNAHDWSWGYKLEGSYHFNTGNDLNINWYHLDNSTTNKFKGVVQILDIAGLGVVDNYTLTTKPQWDAGNIEFGQHVDFGEMKNIRFHGGVQYARINITSEIYANNTSVTGRNNFSSSFNGFGPRLGADMSYDWGYGLSAYANGAAAILVGTSKFNVAGNLATANFLITNSGNDRLVVPELEAKIGAKYTYDIDSGDLITDFGYMWQNYFNAQYNNQAGLLEHKSDFSVHGLYLGFKWIGNVA